MTPAFPKRIAVAAALALLAACGSTPTIRYYALDTVAAPRAAPDARARPPAATIGVRIVGLPGAVDRPQFVVRTAESRVALDEYNRWAGPLKDEIARVVAGDLAIETGIPVVTVSPAMPGPPDLVVLLDVQRFDAKIGEGVDVDVVWIVRRPTGDSPGRSGRTTVREPAAGAGYDALVAAYSRTLAAVSREITVAVRAF